MQSFKLGICQNLPGTIKQDNVTRALSMIKEAASQGAQLVLLPEMFYFVYELNKLRAIAEDNQQTLNILAGAAKEYGIYLCTGTMAEKSGDQIFNKSYLIDPAGKVILAYAKSYLFDVDLPGLVVKESSLFTKGSAYPVTDTAFGKIGILVCYDMRFPETGRALVKQGAEIILIPAAFNHITGPMHWHITLRTRAVENQCFVAAASPARNPHSTYHAYGHSLCVDPWGRILTEADTDETIIYCDCNADVLTDTRMRLPLLKGIGLG